MANRVGQIHASTNPQNWKYVPTKENPADIVSRGASVTQIVNNEYWWNGPECLSKAEEDWPKNKVEKIILEEIEQKSVNKNKNKNSVFFDILKKGTSNVEKRGRLEVITR